MLKVYGVTCVNEDEGVADKICSRMGQAAKIRRFCKYRGLRLQGNSVVVKNIDGEFKKAINMWEHGWIDYIVISSRRFFFHDENLIDVIMEMNNRNALLILDELQFI